MADTVQATRTEDYASSAESERPFLSARLPKLSHASGRALIVAVAVILAWHTWGRWGDLQIDCGRELYVPVEILRGKLLYRDLWYPHGPLASYVEAALVWLFGRHLYVMYLFGLGMSVASALILFQIGLVLRRDAAGLAAALGFLFQGFDSSSFNYALPYAYTAPMSVLLGLLCALFVLRSILSRRARDLVLAGIAAGLAILAKQEIGVACYILLTFVIVTQAVIEQTTRPALNGVIACVPGFAIAAGVYAWFFLKLTARFILFENWEYIPGSYFMRTYGHHWIASVGLALTPTEWFSLIVGSIVALIGWLLIAKLASSVSQGAFLALSICVALGLLIARNVTPLAREVPLVVTFPPGMFFIGLGLFSYSVWELAHNKDRVALAEAAFIVFALALSLRILANIIPFYYSIFYDGPLFLVFLVALEKWIAAAGRRVGLHQREGLMNSLLVLEVVLLAISVVPGTSKRTALLETSWGSIYLRPAEARAAGQILTFIGERKEQGSKVVILPEGHMFYALSGTEAPDRWESLTPGVLSPRQEGAYIADLKRTRPEYIILTNRSTAEYGPPYFGLDYDRGIYDWIQKNYRVSGEFGDFRRARDAPFAGLLYQRQGDNTGGAVPVGKTVKAGS